MPEAALNPELLQILRCPVSKHALTLQGNTLTCGGCGKAFPIVLGIPDLRVYEDPLIPLDDDYKKGARVEAEAARLTFEELVRFYWSLPTYPFTPPDLKERFIDHVLTDEERIAGYRAQLGAGDSFLEVGCGTAALVKVAQGQFRFAVGCDVAFRWLLIARKRLLQAGLPVNLVCCCADFLPFPAHQFDSVASVSLLEHVDDAAAAIGEFGRVAKQDGRIFTWTSNRFSIGPEPHVRVWGVGFLPRRWMPAYVKWARGMAYERKRLLSRFELARFLRQAGFRALTFSLPEIGEMDWKRLRGVELLGARVFAAAGRLPLLASALTAIHPVLQVVARRRAA